MPMPNQSCENCLCWLRGFVRYTPAKVRVWDQVSSFGDCRAAPPTVTPMPSGEASSDFPRTNETDWCRAWEADNGA
jgi:hypothetical protein